MDSHQVIGGLDGGAAVNDPDEYPRERIEGFVDAVVRLLVGPVD
ncbi:hypothetical protein OG225_39365 [Nocardia sp. NBC_01377]